MLLVASDFFSLFLLGLLSSFSHCIGMCGGFVYCYSNRLENSRKIWPHLLYNMGRIFTYGLLGALFAFLTKTTAEVVNFVAWQATILAVAGTVMLLTGLEMLGLWHFSLGTFNKPIENLFIRFTQKQIRRMHNTHEKTKSVHSPLFFLGMILGSIPCGLVYTAGLKAASAATPLLGFFDMVAFGLGTWPALLFIAWSSTHLSSLRRLWLQRIAAILVIILSFATLAQSWNQFQNPGQNSKQPCHTQTE